LLQRGMAHMVFSPAPGYRKDTNFPHPFYGIPFAAFLFILVYISRAAMRLRLAGGK